MTNTLYPPCAGSLKGYADWLKMAAIAKAQDGYCGDANARWCAEQDQRGLCHPLPKYKAPPTAQEFEICLQ